jgi:hypothetical protein
MKYQSGNLIGKTGVCILDSTKAGKLLFGLDLDDLGSDPMAKYA